MYNNEDFIKEMYIFNYYYDYYHYIKESSTTTSGTAFIAEHLTERILILKRTIHSFKEQVWFHVCLLRIKNYFRILFILRSFGDIDHGVT